MIITEPLLERLTNYYTIAQGLETGIVGDFKTVRKLTDGVPNKHKLFTTGRAAVHWLAEKLSERAETKMLNSDEQETLDSCKKLIDEWPQEIVWPTII